MDLEEQWAKARENFTEVKKILTNPNLQMVGDNLFDRNQLKTLRDEQVRIYTRNHFFDMDTMFFATSTPQEIAEYISSKMKEGV